MDVNVDLFLLHIWALLRKATLIIENGPSLFGDRLALVSIIRGPLAIVQNAPLLAQLATLSLESVIEGRDLDRRGFFGLVSVLQTWLAFHADYGVLSASRSHSLFDLAS